MTEVHYLSYHGLHDATADDSIAWACADAPDCAATFAASRSGGTLRREVGRKGRKGRNWKDFDKMCIG